jgi:hypothetical protein
MLEEFAPTLEQMAPLIQKMQSRTGKKKRMARLVQMVEPPMSMAPSGDGSALGVDGLTSLSGDARGRHAHTSGGTRCLKTGPQYTMGIWTRRRRGLLKRKSHECGTQHSQSTGMQELFQLSANNAALLRNFGVRGLLAFIGPGLVRWSGGSRVNCARG